MENELRVSVGLTLLNISFEMNLSKQWSHFGWVLDMFLFAAKMLELKTYPGANEFIWFFFQPLKIEIIPFLDLCYYQIFGKYYELKYMRLDSFWTVTMNKREEKKTRNNGKTVTSCLFFSHVISAFVMCGMCGIFHLFNRGSMNFENVIIQRRY